MTYALIADVHGNLPALEAVLADARRAGAGRHLFLGDYLLDLHWTNEVVDVLRALGDAVLVRGNKEDYLAALGEHPGAQTAAQYASLYWVGRQLSAPRRAYLTALPARAEIAAPGGGRIYLQHMLPMFARPDMAVFRPATYLRARRKNSSLTPRAYAARAAQAVRANPEVMAALGALPPGVHAFGHTHMPFHMAVGERLFVNPGSCGLPSDGDPRAAYALLGQTAGGWQLEQRRVAYDVEGTARALARSPLFEQAEIWSRIVAHELFLALDYMSPFLEHLSSITGERHGPDNPADNTAWQAAAASFALLDIFAQPARP